MPTRFETKPIALLNPIDTAQRQLVRAATADYIQQAAAIFEQRFAPVSVVFDLIGKAAGMYRVRAGKTQIRYNPYIFAKYFEDNVANTVPHEVAHYVTDQVYGLRNIRPHGPQWQALMHAFGATASRTCAYDLTGIPVKVYKRYTYRCACRSHSLTSRRHNKMLRGTARYHCRRCGTALALTRSSPTEDGRSASQGAVP